MSQRYRISNRVPDEQDEEDAGTRLTIDMIEDVFRAVESQSHQQIFTTDTLGIHMEEDDEIEIDDDTEVRFYATDTNTAFSFRPATGTTGIIRGIDGARYVFTNYPDVDDTEG